MIDNLNKQQLVAILKHVTGSGGDYARISIEQYRERVKALDEGSVYDALGWLRIPVTQ